MFFPDLGSEFFPSRIRIRIKEFKHFNPPKIWFLSSRKYDRVVRPGSGSWLFTHPRSRGQKGTGSRTHIRNTAFGAILFLLRALGTGGAGVGVHPAVPEHPRPAALRAGLSGLAPGLPPPLTLAHRGSHRFRFSVCIQMELADKPLNGNRYRRFEVHFARLPAGVWSQQRFCAISSTRFGILNVLGVADRYLLNWILVEELPVAPLGPLRQCQCPLSLHASILYTNLLSI